MKKRVFEDDTTVRVLELSPKWDEREWCRRAHCGYVLTGTLHLAFQSSSKKLQIRKGQGFKIPAGYLHRASCKSSTRLFIIG